VVGCMLKQGQQRVGRLTDLFSGDTHWSCASLSLEPFATTLLQRLAMRLLHWGNFT
jgi:hypothetical protein